MSASAKVRYTLTTCETLSPGRLLAESLVQRSTLLLNTKACLKVL